MILDEKWLNASVKTEKAVEEVMFHPIRYCSHSLGPRLHPLIISKIPVVIYRKMLYTYNKKNMFNRKDV